MKRVLITGKNSYIGTSLENWLMRTPSEYEVEVLDMKNPGWKDFDFRGFDTVVHVAGIAHSGSGKSQEELYLRVNRDLAIETAKKAKAEGVGQFVFMSSILIYGNSAGKKGVIDKDTIPRPNSIYGISKLQAEKDLKKLESEAFQVSILRAPFIYGRNCKGNYQRLARLARWIPIFPDIDNRRSMLHIDNLCELMKILIDRGAGGTYFPQNSEYVRTGDLVRVIGKQHGHKIRLTSLFNCLIKHLLWIKTVNKLFGSLYYDKSISHHEDFNYGIRAFEESIELTEKAERGRWL